MKFILSFFKLFRFCLKVCSQSVNESLLDINRWNQMLNKASLGSDINVIEFFDSFLLMFILHLTCFHVEAKPKLTKDLFLFVLTLFLPRDCGHESRSQNHHRHYAEKLGRQCQKIRCSCEWEKWLENRKFWLTSV